MTFFEKPEVHPQGGQKITKTVPANPQGLHKLLRTFLLYLTSAVVIAVGVTIFYLNFAKGTEAAWYDDTFAYRQTVTFTHNAAITSERRVVITIDTTGLVTNSKIQSTCADARFTDANGKPLRYQLTSACNLASTTFDVVFLTINNGSNLAYFYYGNPAAVSGSTTVSDVTALTPSGAPSVATETQGPAPISYWGFNEAQGATANDYSTGSNNDLTITNAVWKTTDLCVFGNCLYFDGNADRATKSYSTDTELLPGTGSFTVSAWFKHSSTAGADTLISRADAVAGIGWKVYMDSSGYMCFGIDAVAGTFPNDSACSTTSYADSKWHFVTAVKSGTTSITIYIDGAQIAQDAAITSTTISGTNAPFTVGNDFDNGTNGWVGFIDEVKYYNFAKTASQITAEFASKSTAKGAAATFGTNQAGASLSTGLIAWWKMDESSWTQNCSTTSVTDSSGNGNNGQSCPSTTGPAGGAAGKFGNGGNFDASDDYILVNDSDSLDVTSQFTISAWVNPNTVATTHYIISKDGVGTDTTDAFGFSLGSSGGSTHHIEYETNNRGAVSTTTAIVPTSAWSFVSVTYNSANVGAEVNLYYNGTVVKTGTVSAPIALTTNLLIGRRGSNTTPYVFDGKLDDVRVYNRALSGAEVNQLYNFAPRPIVEIKMEEKVTGDSQTLYDTSGNGFNGTTSDGANNTGMDCTQTGKLGSACIFDGDDDSITIGNISSRLNLQSTTPPSFTVSAWFNYESDITQYSLGGVILMPSYNVRLYYYDNNFGFQLRPGETAVYTSTLTANRWYFITGVYDAFLNQLRIYRDGVFQASATPSSTDLSALSMNMMIGFAQGYFEGMIDNVTVYNYARTPGQIIEDMNAGHPAPGSPVGSYVARWKFDEANGTTANDSSINSNSLTLSSASWSVPGKFTNAWNGTNAVWLSRADDADFDFAATEDFSISTWFKSDSATNPSATEYIVNKASSIIAGYAVYANTSGQICFGIDDDTTWNPDVASCSSSDIYDNSWHHIVAVRNTTLDNLYLYVDGLLVDSDSDTTTATLANSLSLYVGDRDGTNNGDEFTGDLDELKIYRLALTSSEVAIDKNFNSAATMGKVDDTGNEGFGGNPPVGWWKMDENTGTTTSDSSGNGNTSSAFTGNTTWAIGKTGSALTFDGTDDYVDISIANNLMDWAAAQSFSYGMWINVDTSVGSAEYVLDRTTASNALQGVYLNAGIPNCQIRDGDGVGINSLSLLSTLAAGTWHHIFCVRDVTNDKLYGYLDGQLANSATDTTTGAWSDFANPRVGCHQNGLDANCFDGRIDDYRVYNYARTPAQIAYDYNRGAPVGWWKFDECQGATAYNAALNANGQAAGMNGTITPGSLGNTTVGSCGSGTTTEMWNDGTTGKYNSALGFDGTDDYITVTNSDPIDQNVGLVNGLTASAWIYANNAGEGTGGRIFTKNTATWCRVDTLSGSNLDVQCSLDLTTDATLNVSAPITTGTWNHVVMTWTNDSDDDITLWVNGKNVGSSTDGVGDPSADTANLIIGNDSTSGTATFDGLIDQFQIFNYEMTAAQIARLFNEGSAVRFGPQTGSP